MLRVKTDMKRCELDYSDYFDFSDYMKHVRGDLFKEIIYDILEGCTICW